jgi:hypothetical protein
MEEKNTLCRNCSYFLMVGGARICKLLRSPGTTPWNTKESFTPGYIGCGIVALESNLGLFNSLQIQALVSVETPLDYGVRTVVLYPLTAHINNYFHPKAPSSLF